MLRPKVASTHMDPLGKDGLIVSPRWGLVLTDFKEVAFHANSLHPQPVIKDEA